MIVERMPTNIIKGQGRRHQHAHDGDVPGLRLRRQGQARDLLGQPDGVLDARSRPPRSHQARRSVQDVADDSSEMPHILINQARLHELFLEGHEELAVPPRTRLQLGSRRPDGRHDDRRPPRHRDPEGTPAESTGGPPARCARTTSSVATARTRRCARPSAAPARRRRPPGLGRDGHPGQHRLPDVRQKCLISSASEGNVLILPREGGYIFRMYVELTSSGRTRRQRAASSPRRHDRGGQPHPAALHDRREGGGLVVHLRHRPQHHRPFDDVPEGRTAAPAFTAGMPATRTRPRRARA